MQSTQYKRNTLKKPSKRKKILLAIGILILAILVVGLLEITNKTYFFHDRKAVSGTIQSKPTTDEKASVPSEKETDPTTTSPQNPSTTDPAESPKEGDTPSTPLPTGAAPVAPYGNFVSNHSPNLDGKPAPSSIESVCNTSPGARCRLEFTNKDGVVKNLEARTADSSGGAFWSWDINQAGLTVGTWKIKAIAEMNNQTKVTESTQNLEVGA